MSTPTMTRDLAWSAAQDAANRQMRAAGRSKWSQDDYRLAVETFDRLWPEERDYTRRDVFDDYEGCDSGIDTAPVPICRTVLHIDGDPTNNDLDNLEVRTGYADVDPERKGRES